MAGNKCHLWGPLNRVLGPSLSLAGSWSPQIPPTISHHFPSQEAPSHSSVGLDLGKDLLLLDPAILKPYGDLAL